MSPGEDTRKPARKKRAGPVNAEVRPRKNTAGHSRNAGAGGRTRQKAPVLPNQDIIRDLPDPTFVINRTGSVIAWNRAMEDLTGVPAPDVVGKGDYEYALPFYGERRPILIDIALDPEVAISPEYNNLCCEGRAITATTREAHPKGKDVILWGKAAPLMGENGTIAGAIETIRDITAATRLQVQNAANEERLRALLHNASDIIRIVDREGKIVFDTAASERVLGYPPGYTLGKSPSAFIHPDDVPEVQRGFSEVFEKTSTGVPTEFRIRKADGSYAWVESVGKNMFGIPGIDGIVITTRFIDERKEAEKALCESEEKFRGMAERSSDLVCILNKEMSPAYVSPSARLIIGYDPEELVGKTLEFAAATIFSESTPGFMNAVRAVMKGVPVENAELRINKKDGTPAYVSLHAVPIMRDGTLAGVQVSMRDITAGKKAEKALLESENKFRTIFRYSPVSFALVSATDETFVDVNDAFVRNTGYSRDEVIGRTSEDLGIIADSDERKRMVTSLRNQQSIHGMEVKCRTKTGDVRTCLFSSGFIQMGGKPHVLSTIEDITGRKQAEEALRGSEEKFRDIFNNTNDAIQIIGLDENRHLGRFLDVNDVSCRMLQYSREELLQKGPYDLETDSSNKTKEVIGRDVETLGSSTFETVQIRKNSSLIPVEISVRPAILQGKRVIISVVRDITERRQAEEALRESEARYSSLFDNNYSVSLLIDPDNGRIVDANAAAARYYGYSHDQLIKMGIYDLNRLPGEKVVQNLNKAKNESPKHFFSTHYLADGNRRNMEIYSGPITVNGKPLFYSIIHDITDRKKAEGALRESEERYRTLIDQIPDYVIVHRRGIILYVNPAAARDLGYKSAELLGTLLTEFVLPEYHETVQKSIVSRMNGEMVDPYEIEIMANDGTKRTVLVNGAYVVFEGKPASLNVLTDITIRKAAEDFIKLAKEELEDRVAERTWELTQANEQLAEEIRARNRAERIIKQSLDEKDLLLREIHHRVKNNLQIVASLLNLQSRYITDKKVLESIRDSQNRVRAMALVHERIYRSHEISSINLAEYLRYLTNQIFRFYNIPQTQVEVSVAVDRIMADIDTAIPVGLIINELVSNALKHAFPYGRTGTIRIEGKLLDTGQIRFVFRDNGVGIPTGIDWKNTTSLGLRLVKSLTEQMMGTVTMEQDGGTVFTITVKPRTLIKAAKGGVNNA